MTIKLLEKPSNNLSAVMPAKAGIQCNAECIGIFKPWIPAFAGTTAFCRLSLVLALCCAAFLTGCGSSAKTYYYTLQPLGQTTSAAKPTTPVVSIAITSLKLPELVDRPQLVLRQGETQVLIDDNHLWGQALKSEILDSLAHHLAQERGALQVILPGQSGAAEAQYKITVDILRFDSILGAEAILEARWRISGKPDTQPKTGHALVRENASGAVPYDALVAAHRRAVAKLAREIAGGL